MPDAPCCCALIHRSSPAQHISVIVWHSCLHVQTNTYTTHFLCFCRLSHHCENGDGRLHHPEGHRAEVPVMHAPSRTQDKTTKTRVRVDSGSDRTTYTGFGGEFSRERQSRARENGGGKDEMKQQGEQTTFTFIHICLTLQPRVVKGRLRNKHRRAETTTNPYDRHLQKKKRSSGTVETKVRRVFTYLITTVPPQHPRKTQRHPSRSQLHARTLPTTSTLPQVLL